VFFLHARLRARRAPGIPCALCFSGGHELQASDASRREKAVLFLIVIASEAKQSILSSAAWIASRRLSSGAHSRDPLARNDGN
jgi:hypothetical protein